MGRKDTFETRAKKRIAALAFLGKQKVRGRVRGGRNAQSKKRASKIIVKMPTNPAEGEHNTSNGGE